MIEQGAQVFIMGEPARDRVGLAVAAQVIAYRPVVLGKRRKLIVPHARIADTGMEQHQRRPLPGHFVIQPRSVDVGKTCAHVASRCLFRNHASSSVFSSPGTSSTASMKDRKSVV